MIAGRIETIVTALQVCSGWFMLGWNIVRKKIDEMSVAYVRYICESPLG